MPPPPFRRCLPAGLLCALLLVSARAAAQLQAPGLPGPQLPQGRLAPLTDFPRQLGPRVRDTATELDSRAGTAQRALRIRTLLRRHRAVVEADPDGEPMVRRRLVALSPSPEARKAFLAAGFSVVRETALAGLGLQLVLLAPPEDMSTRRALQELHRLDSTGSYDYDHIYTTSGALASDTAPTAAAGEAAAAAPAGAVLGLIDSGVDTGHPVFSGVAIQRWGCGGQALPAAHGTAVASLLVGQGERFRGAAPGARLYAADVYCGEPTGGALDTIISAAAWLAQTGVPVINISLVGPPNILLQQVVRRLIDSGHIVVAAVGNDGPAAAPLYPAAYAGVIGVTGVDARRRVLVEACRGAQVSFAAPGADMAAAAKGGGYTAVRGTSFAAPIVAGLLALHLTAPGSAAAERAQRQLAASAVDLGAKGRDNTYGFGLVGAAQRVPPSRSLPGIAAGN